jgi:hypothetical protein
LPSSILVSSNRFVDLMPRECLGWGFYERLFSATLGPLGDIMRSSVLLLHACHPVGEEDDATFTVASQ